MIDRAIDEDSKVRGELFAVRQSDAAQCFGKADDVVRSRPGCQGFTATANATITLRKVYY